MKIKKLLSVVWVFIVGLWNKVDALVEKATPIAIKIVNEIKKVNESTPGDIIDMILSKAIPGTADDAAIDIIRAKLREILPNVILALNMSESIAKIEDPNEQLKAILVAINMSSDQAKNAYYHSFCAMIIQALSDGKLTWSESVQLGEYYYSYLYKK